ncbi:MAG: hypothetical protein IPG56_10925 [Caulobacteraceae bacterium]|jgi:hypothetical protein|nr:hypothetical protein [Caulobacteraceae bacterium]
MRSLVVIAALFATACSPPAPTAEAPVTTEIPATSVPGPTQLPAGARDIVWGDAPQAVRDLVATTPNTFLPDRVIQQAPGADGSVIYELWSASASEPIDVSYANGQAAIMPPRH